MEHKTTIAVYSLRAREHPSGFDSRDLGRSLSAYTRRKTRACWYSWRSRRGALREMGDRLNLCWSETGLPDPKQAAAVAAPETNRNRRAGDEDPPEQPHFKKKEILRVGKSHAGIIRLVCWIGGCKNPHPARDAARIGHPNELWLNFSRKPPDGLSTWKPDFYPAKLAQKNFESVARNLMP